MFRIVSDKTGYPVEMLDQSMDMEADLGIDSIKEWRFLIAPRPTSRIPRNKRKTLPNKKPGSNPQSPSNPDSSVDLQQLKASLKQRDFTEIAGSPQNSFDSSGPAQALLNVIAEKTGYPAEMLELSMDMERISESIPSKKWKSWALQEQFPNCLRSVVGIWQS